MPTLKNARHEAFARGLALENLTADQAYARAGFKRSRTNAARLARTKAIRARVDELATKVAEKAEWKAADRLKLLADVAAKHVAKDPRATISAIAEANKMQGSYAPTKSELTGRDGGPIEFDLSGLTDDELKALEPVLSVLAALGGSAGRAAGTGEGGEATPDQGSGEAETRD